MFFFSSSLTLPITLEIIKLVQMGRIGQAIDLTNKCYSGIKYIHYHKIITEKNERNN